MHSPFPTPLLSKPSFDALPSLGRQRLLTFSMAPPYHNLALGQEAWPTNRPGDAKCDNNLQRRAVTLQRRAGGDKQAAECYCDACDTWVEFRWHLYRKVLPAHVQDNRAPSRFECIHCYSRVKGISLTQAKSHFRARVGTNKPERKQHFEGSPNESPPKST